MTRQKQSRNDSINYSGIALVILAIAVLYIVYNYFTAVLIVGSLSIIIIVAIIVVAAYYILPAIGLEGLAALIGIASAATRPKRK